MNSMVKSTILRPEAYHETKRHSDTMFAYNVYPCTIPMDFSFVPVHWQDSFEIIYVKKGSGLVQVDFETYTAKAGDIFLVMPGHLHSIRSLSMNRMEYENIIFDPAFLDTASINLFSQKYWQPLLLEALSLPVYIGPEHELHPSISSLLDASDILCSTRPAGYELGVKGNLMLVFSCLFGMATDSGHYNEKHEEKLKTILSYLEENYDKKLTVEEMARTVGYSASHFMRWFKEMTGVGFGAYLIEFRLERAAQALRSTQDTILAISEQNGFDNLSNFNRLFKKKFQMTPSQFRRQVTGRVR